MSEKRKIKNIVNNLITIKNKKNIFFYNTLKKLNQISNKKCVLIFKGNQIFKNVIKVYFYFLYSNIKFKKNFFLLFNIKNNLYIGHNLFPDWPGKYLKNNFFNNLFIWIKKFIYIAVFRKKLELIFIQII